MKNFLLIAITKEMFDLSYMALEALFEELLTSHMDKHTRQLEFAAQYAQLLWHYYVERSHTSV